MGKASRDKGARWEREVSKTLRDQLGVEFRRNISETASHRVGVDILSDDLPVLVQCKNMAKPQVFKAMAEIRAATRYGELGFAAIKRTSSAKVTEEVAVVDLDMFVTVLRFAIRGGIFDLPEAQLKEKE